ncbi:MAG: glycine cleavage system aminomethyltransferase GcvT [Tepidanaerobacter acetatoxydans]|jgi:aminomethyltransferase|uniref:glycine cleavage system aminomethyltransferase GcvT n=1 Tax=Tepidanaerobacter acetatoxydans TaxID=499229 RepID=UPI0026F3411F|nr:glycine cleavage system aminomethyltransferase GcvT [Tepidanaerobacter acetatoxydans]NLU09658.1 glycine cleavage system aminomethyltransferase GcvT [Tepidanaerobacter acetatoxydans]
MLKRTPLYEEHLKLGAKMVDFAGFEMPIQYSSIIDEHMAVRTKSGIFDVSHMGEILVKGENAGDFLNGILTNNIHKIKEGQVQYTIMTYDNGGTVDDLMAYKLSLNQYLLVVNAANKDKDFEHIKSLAPADVVVEDVSDDYGLIAIQGPESVGFIKELFGEIQLKPFNFRTIEFDSDSLILSRTGYTGGEGFEVYGSLEMTRKLFCKAVDFGVTPCGLGARDTLRFEAGLPLYGHELGPDITPVEAGLSRFIDLSKPFKGRDVLRTQSEQRDRRRLIGLKLLDRGVPRPDYPVYYDGKQVGKVTSGGFAPYVKEYLAMALVKIPLDDANDKLFEIEIRGKKHRAEKVSTNFLKG